MATFTHDVVVYGSTEWGLFYAINAVKQGYSVALICENNHVGGLTAGSLGVQDIAGQPMLIAIRGGEYNRYIRQSAFTYGLRDSRLIVPSAVERQFFDRLGYFGIDVFRSEQIASATLDGSNKITAITMIGGNVFQADVFFDGSMCNDLVQAAGEEDVTWTIGTESADAYSESKGGYQISYSGAGDAYLAGAYDALSIPDPGLATGDAYEGVQAYAYRVIYSAAASGDYTPFNIAQITQLNSVKISVMDGSHYDPDRFVFYAATRAGERSLSIENLSGGGRGFLPNALFQDNDDIPLVSAGRPRHWDYSKFNTADPAATYSARAQLEYDIKLFIMQSRAWMMTDSRYSGAWQDSCASFGWPQREFRGNNNLPWQLYIREGVRPLGDYILAQDDITVEDDMAARSIFKDDSIALAGYAFDTHISAYSPVGTSSSEYRLIGKTASGAPDTSDRGYAIPFSSMYNSARPNLFHVPSSTHIAWSSLRIVQNLILAAEGAAYALPQLLDGGLAPADVVIADVQALLDGDGLVYTPLA